MKNAKGFTLLELLIAIGVMAILAGLVLVAVNPAQQFGKANDAERKSEAKAVLSAMLQFQTSPSARGALPRCLTGAVPAAADIPECDTDSSGIGVGNGGFEGALELGTPGSATVYDCTTLLIPFYLREMPIDPDAANSATDTGYFVCQDTSGAVERIYIIAPDTQVFTDDGGCEVPGTTTPTMCVSS